MEPRAEIEELVRKAAYDDSGYSVEGAFVDSFRYSAEDAAGALANIFAAHGFTAADEALIRDAVRDPAAGKEAPPIMLSTLLKWTRPLIEQLLHDPLPYARMRALCAARWTTPGLSAEFLEDPDPQVRWTALESLAMTWRTSSDKIPNLPFLVDRRLTDPEARLRTRAADLLDFAARGHDPSALIARLDAEPDDGVRSRIVYALGNKLNPSVGVSQSWPWRANVVQTLLRELNAAGPKVRKEAAAALASAYDKDLDRPLFARLRVEANADVRAALVNRAYGPTLPEAFPLLVELLAGDPSSAVRTNVAFNLGGFGAAAVEPLIDAVRQNNSVRAAAITLGRIADERAIPALRQALENPENRSCRSDIADAIRWCSWRKDNGKAKDS